MTSDTSHTTLALPGPHTVRQAAETHAALTAALRESGDLVLDCEGVTEADLSLIQCILAAQRSAAAQGKALRLTSAPQGAVRSVLQRGGFAHPDAPDPENWVLS